MYDHQERLPERPKWSLEKAQSREISEAVRRRPLPEVPPPLPPRDVPAGGIRSGVSEPQAPEKPVGAHPKLRNFENIEIAAHETLPRSKGHKEHYYGYRHSLRSQVENVVNGVFSPRDSDSSSTSSSEHLERTWTESDFIPVLTWEANRAFALLSGDTEKARELEQRIRKRLGEVSGTTAELDARRFFNEYATNHDYISYSWIHDGLSAETCLPSGSDVVKLGADLRRRNVLSGQQLERAVRKPPHEPATNHRQRRSCCAIM